MGMREGAARRNACEFMNKLVRRDVVCGVVAALFLLVVGSANAQEQPTPPKPAQGQIDAPPHQYEPQVGEEHAEEHGMFSGLLWPTVNFAILFGGLWWLLKQPIATYLTDQHQAIRKDLVDAANVKAAAAAQLSEIDRKLQALPGELDALKRRGAEEIAAEEQRIAAMAAAERDRLLEQTRREIELQLRLAKRELVEHAAELSVQLATERIQKTITPADQERLVDRYTEELRTKN
jgi:F-type H+-transporting ATPase subunit b